MNGLKTAVREGWLELDGLRIHYFTGGDQGSPVVLLHGGGSDSALLSWRLTIEPVAERYRVFAPDWPGHGESDIPRGKCTTGYYLGFLRRLLDTVFPGQPVGLVGISLGGAVALGFTLECPERAGRLVLVDSYGLGDRAPWHTLSYFFVHIPLLNELSWVLLRYSRTMLRSSLRGVIRNPGRISQELVEEVAALVSKPGAGAAFRSWQRSELGWGGLRTNYVSRLPEITLPTLIVHGADDTLVPRAWAERAHRLIRHSQLCVIPDCGHWLPREKPEDFNRMLLDFLSRSRW